MDSLPIGLFNSSQRRKLFTVPYSKNSRVGKSTPDFGKQNYSGLSLVLTAPVNKSGGTVFGTAAVESPFTLVKAITIKAGGKIIKDMPATSARVNHYIYRGAAPSSTGVTAANGAQTASFELYIDFEKLKTVLPTSATGLIGPELTNLPGQRYDTLEFEIQWGSEVDLLYGTTDYSTFNVDPTATLDVYGEIHMSPALLSLRQYLLNIETFKKFPISATQAAAEFKLPAGGNASYSGILLQQYTDAAPPVAPVTNIIADTAAVVVTANNGTFRLLETQFGRLRAQNLADYGLAMPTGFAFIDFLRSRDYRKALRAEARQGIASIECLIDVTTQTNAFIGFGLKTLEPGR